ncbi:proline dehydrogenase family protein [Auraticoccus monumenti]|uniref:proline dehydrogenase n=1 Tax=Auraticoccus monumenti TaxID=675864 RepID=A0A1G6RPL0_9ACTN|nr:proline dehydrogenase family protein [Auraticoccus monumenti]SDD06579.1 L-proline dehydrogenase [Auraticoccus monumenti]
MLRRLLLKAAGNERIKDAALAVPLTRGVVARFVAGETTEDALDTCRLLSAEGLLVTVDHLGEDTTDRGHAEQVTAAYLELLAAIRAEGLGPSVEVSVKLSAIGQLLPGDGETVALEKARSISAAARNAGTTVTVDMEDHTTTDSTLSIVEELRKDFPSTGAVLQSYLRRTEADCERLAGSGSRIRLCKGAYAEPDEVAFSGADIDLAYVRCLKVLMQGQGYPMVATHDPRLVAIALDLASRNHRAPDSWELQMLHGIRPDEQRRLVAAGHQVRVYLPYGTDWYGYLVRRMAEKPSNLALFLKGLTSRG